MKLIRGAPGSGKTAQFSANSRPRCAMAKPTSASSSPPPLWFAISSMSWRATGIVFSPRSRRVAEPLYAGTRGRGETRPRRPAWRHCARLRCSASASRIRRGRKHRRHGRYDRRHHRPLRKCRLHAGETGLCPQARPARESRSRSCGAPSAKPSASAAITCAGDWIRRGRRPTRNPPANLDGRIPQLQPDRAGIPARGLVKVCDVTLTITDSPATDEIRKFALRWERRIVCSRAIRAKPQTTLISARTLEREADEIARRILALTRTGHGVSRDRRRAARCRNLCAAAQRNVRAVRHPRTFLFQQPFTETSRGDIPGRPGFRRARRLGLRSLDRNPARTPALGAAAPISTDSISPCVKPCRDAARRNCSPSANSDRLREDIANCLKIEQLEERPAEAARMAEAIRSARGKSVSPGDARYCARPHRHRSRAQPRRRTTGMGRGNGIHHRVLEQDR